MKTPKKTGVAEWADASYNLQLGCPNRCLYCYARAQALRFKRTPSAAAWATPITKPALPPMPKNTRVMFPTNHDITPDNLDLVIKALRGLLSRGNRVLIVSKPHPECIEAICRNLPSDKILFRFSIGTMDESLRQLWEPNAPTIDDRIKAFGCAHSWGFQTSISMEPFLGDISDATATFHAMAPYVTEKIWLGKMNKISARVDTENDEIYRACQKILENQCDYQIIALYHALKNEPKVAWKDSIQEVLHRNGISPSI